MPLRVFVVAPSAMLTDARPHGDGLVAFGFIRELAARGHELHVAAGQVDLRDSLPPNAHLHVLGGGDGLPAPLERLRYMRRVRAVYRRLASEAKFDVVHQLTPVEVGVTLVLTDPAVPVLLGPYVPEWEAGEDAATVQGPVSARVKQGLRAAQQGLASTALLSNPAAASKVSGHFRRQLHVRELPLGIDERVWVAPRGRQPGQDVLFLASLDIRKGIYVALDAFWRLVTQYPEARLLVGGAGPELEEVRRRVRASPDGARVALLGHLERDRAVTAMQGCDVYCLPSFGDAHPLTALEAMACGKPLVVTSAGGLGHIVPDEGGRKVPAGDAAALASALGELLADPGLRRAMGAHNRRVVEEHYSWARVVDRLEVIYEEAIRDPRPRSLRPMR
jgi:L-malate glycosyltransferase